MGLIVTSLLIDEGMVRVLLSGVFWGGVYFCTMLPVGRKYLVPITILAIFALWFPYSIIFGIPALVLGGIASFIFMQIDRIHRWYWHIPIVLALFASGLIIYYSMNQNLAIAGLPIVGTLILYPLVSGFIRGEGKESIMFLGSSAAICSVFSWGFAAAFGGGRETTLSEIDALFIPYLAMFPGSRYIMERYVEILFIALIFLGCIILADYLGRSLETLKSSIANETKET